MSDYFDPSINRIAAGSLAKSEQVNNLRDETSAGFDQLPPPDVINQGRATFAADTGSVNQYEIELASTVNAYETHLTVSTIPAHDNTGASTLNVNGLGAVAIKDNDGDDLHAGVLITTGVNSFTYNGTHFVLAGVTSAALEGLTSEAESARDIAVASATAAGISEVSADADATQVALDRIQTTADATQTASDRVQTGLDRVQTGLDRASSTTSASDAANSAATIDVAKLAGIEDNATTDQTDAEILASVNNNAGVTLSGINTGDQTDITGNAGTATALQTARTIDITGDITATAVAFDGTSNIAISAKVDGLGNFKNKIINGGFDVWQRGTDGVSASSGYTADRWKQVSDATSKEYTFNVTALPDGSIAKCIDLTATGQTSHVIQQHIEGMRYIQNKTVTISAYIKGVAFTGSLMLTTRTTGGTLVQEYSTPIQITPTLQKFTFTVSIPLSSAFDDNDAFYSLSIYGGDTFSVTQAQLEEGTVATEFEQRPLSVEQMLCYRYYWQFAGAGSYLFVTNDSTTSRRGILQFPTAMRVIPSYNISYSTGTGNPLVINKQTTTLSVNVGDTTSNAIVVLAEFDAEL